MHEGCRSSTADLAMLLLLAAVAAVIAGLAAAKWAPASVARSAAAKFGTPAGTSLWFGAPPQPASCALREDTYVACGHLACGATY